MRKGGRHWIPMVRSDAGCRYSRSVFSATAFFPADKKTPLNNSAQLLILITELHGRWWRWCLTGEPGQIPHPFGHDGLWISPLQMWRGAVFLCTTVADYIIQIGSHWFVSHQKRPCIQAASCKLETIHYGFIANEFKDFQTLAVISHAAWLAVGHLGFFPHSASGLCDAAIRGWTVMHLRGMESLGLCKSARGGTQTYMMCVNPGNYGTDGIWLKAQFHFFFVVWGKIRSTHFDGLLLNAAWRKDLIQNMDSITGSTWMDASAPQVVILENMHRAFDLLYLCWYQNSYVRHPILIKYKTLCSVSPSVHCTQIDYYT